MSLPPPIPTSAGSRKGIPGWTWPIIVGAPLVLIAFALLIQVTPVRKPMEAWRPAMGVPQTQPDEQLSIGADGAFVYRNKKTGVERSVRNEPEPVAEPAWLHVPADVQRLSAEGRRGGGRRQAMFQYSLHGDLDDAFTIFGHPLMAEGFRLRRDSRSVAMQLIGADMKREVFVYATRTGKVVQVEVHITEPGRP